VAEPDSHIPTPHHGQNSEDPRWKWASSTLLLAYGQMAAKAKIYVLPWVDNILARMIFYFRYSSWVRGLHSRWAQDASPAPARAAVRDPSQSCACRSPPLPTLPTTQTRQGFLSMVPAPLPHPLRVL
jgi:hypothetical protein